MFLHLGGEVVVNKKDIIAILDITSTLISKDTRDFLKVCEEEGFIEEISQEEPRAFVVVERLEKRARSYKGVRKVTVYKSPISAVTLQKRASCKNIFPLEQEGLDSFK
ncbi:MAG: DUF370 domain-containing protein [Clostridiaceae bacterium]|nr:DUF370 domain-containing protein [Clostridiaceae bacterium]